MKPIEEIFELTIRYVHQEMLEEEREEFEKRYQEDEVFRKAVGRNMQTLGGLGREQIRAQVGLEVASFKEEQHRRRFKQWGRVAAGMVLLFGLLLFIRHRSEPDLAKIYADNHEFLLVGNRGEAPAWDSLWNASLDHYESRDKQNFAKAIVGFKELLADTAFVEVLGNRTHLYLGAAYLEIEEPDSAMQAFEQVSSASAAYYGDAVWYRALALLQKEDAEGACQEFLAIEGDPRWSMQRREQAIQVAEALQCER